MLVELDKIKSGATRRSSGSIHRVIEPRWRSASKPSRPNSNAKRIDGQKPRFCARAGRCRLLLVIARTSNGVRTARPLKSTSSVTSRLPIIGDAN